MITTRTEGDVLVVELDRHERRNALDLAHCRDLEQVARAVAGGPARAVVITGAGSSFCAGADLTGVYGSEFRAALAGMLASITEIAVPVIAAVNGPAIGAGTQLAIACDLRVAAPAARFAIPTARNGLAVDGWTIGRLASLAGGGAARAMLIGCETLGTDAALARGLVDRTGDPAAALAWAHELAGLAPLSLRYAKLALQSLAEPDRADPRVAAAFQACWDSEDAAEAELARSEKRAPRFTGR
jgi:enoyl-CoA hydratase